MSYIKKNELFLLEEIVKRDFSSKYKDSALGIFWTVLSPLLMMALFTILFSTLFSRNIENFPVYFLSGWCLFQFFNASISMSMNALRSNKTILQRTPAPKHIFILGGIISEFLNYIIMLILLVAIMIITNAPFHWSTLFISIIPIISILLMITGLGLILAIVCVYYSDVKHLWTVISMMLMYSSALFFPMEMIPEPFYSYFILNPLYWIINQFRCTIYTGMIPQIGNMINSILLSLIILVLGIIIFKKYEKKVTMRF